MLVFYETASTQDEGHGFAFGYIRAAICVRETHGKKCTKPLEAEDCFWSEASQKLQSNATKEAEFYCPSEFGGRFFPDKYQYENVQPSQHQDCNFWGDSEAEDQWGYAWTLDT